MRSLQAMVLLLALALSAACVSVPGTAAGKPDVAGELTIQGPTFGDTRQAVDRCVSGEHEVFLGADFAGPGPLVARLAIDPLSGPGVRVFDATAPFGKSFVIRQSECDHFHFSLQRSGWRINDIWALHLTLDIDCSAPSGDTIRGTVSSASCW